MTRRQVVNAYRLGKAVHPGALARLHELYPDVRVYVRHITHDHPDAQWYKFDDVRRPQVHTTQVWLRFSEREGDYLYAQAKQHPNDNWDRKFGIRLAFDRALASARKRHANEAWEKSWTRLDREAPGFA